MRVCVKALIAERASVGVPGMAYLCLVYSGWSGHESLWIIFHETVPFWMARSISSSVHAVALGVDVLAAMIH